MNSKDILESASYVLKLEAAAILSTLDRLDQDFTAAVELILNCEGRVVVTGMGKSGLVARKISATLASLGTVSLYLHPADALHGDLGMIKNTDVILMLSNSGETEELIRLQSFFQNIQVPTILISSSGSSTLAQHATCWLDGSVEQEACNMNLAPTCSTTVAMAIGDAIAVSVSKQKGFTEQDFAFYHPHGSLGKRLLCTVDEIMHSVELPCCTYSASVKDAISIMTQGKLGVVFITESKSLLGLLTDGDLRRHLEESSNLEVSISEIMTSNPITVDAKTVVDEARSLMIDKKISILPVLSDNILVGSVQLFDCS